MVIFYRDSSYHAEDLKKQGPEEAQQFPSYFPHLGARWVHKGELNISARLELVEEDICSWLHKDNSN